jgi:hypothetical protein
MHPSGGALRISQASCSSYSAWKIYPARDFFKRNRTEPSRELLTGEMPKVPAIAESPRHPGKKVSHSRWPAAPQA